MLPTTNETCEITHSKNTAQHLKQFLSLTIQQCNALSQCYMTSGSNCWPRLNAVHNLLFKSKIRRCCRISKPACILQILFQENIRKEFMFSLPLSQRCTGSGIFKAVNHCFTAKDISWQNCVGICTHGDRTQKRLSSSSTANLCPCGPYGLYHS
jgi:hypothetical protein